MCGKNVPESVVECYNLASDGAAWTKVVDPAVPQFENINNAISSFIYDNKMWFVEDNYPKVFDFIATPPKFQLFWDSVANPPTINSHQTSGDGCAVAVGDFVYQFGGKTTAAIQRFLLKPAATGVTRQWEYLTDLPSYNLRACASLPTDRNQILVAMLQTDPTVLDAIVFNVNQKTLTPVQSTVSLVGASLVEMCRSSNLYAFPIGARAKMFEQNPADGSNFWSDVVSPSTLSITRTVPSVVMVPFDFGRNFTSPIICNGC